MIEFQDRNAWQIGSEEIRATILECGAHVAEIVCKAAGEINPLWVQNRPTIDSDRFDPAIHGHIYGTDSEARLISGLLGHNLCFPYWGRPSAAEEAAGMTFHGESNILRWKMLDGQPHWLKLAVTLPNCSIRFEREVRCVGNVIYFSEAATNLSAWDRPVGWCEHVTLGPPFLEPGSTVMVANLTRGFRTDDEEAGEFQWPEGHGTIPCLLTGVSTVQHSDFVNSFLVDPAAELGHFAAWHPRLRLLFGYVFPRREFPWMTVWEDHTAARLTRGMEFRNTPIDGTMRQLLRKAAIWDVPVYDWIDAKSTLRKNYAAFAVATPEGFRGPAKVAVGGGKLNIVELGTGNTLALDWAPDHDAGAWAATGQAERGR
jgi:hypothetical protein